MSFDRLDKRELLTEVRAALSAELEAVAGSQRATQDGATHEETRAEDPKDTRSTEASYLARGLATRVADLREGLARLGAVVMHDGDDEQARLGSLVAAEDEDEREATYLILPAGAGLTLASHGLTVRVVTPSSPLGRALLGTRKGDDCEIARPTGATTLAILRVR